MIPNFYCDVFLHQSDYGSVVDTYIDWLLGKKEFRDYRTRRLQAGIEKGWLADDLKAGRSFHGLHDCTIATRVSGGLFLLRFVHRDGRDGSILWHTAVRLQKLETGTRVEHGVSRSFPRNTEGFPIAASPGIFTHLLKQNGVNVSPRDLWSADALQLRDDEVEQFVRYILLDPSRELPFVVVTAEHATQRPIVDPQTLAKKLVGMARVAVLPNLRSEAKFRHTLREQGYSREFAVFDGGIRIYEPGLNVTQSPFQHYLWIPRRIQQIAGHKRLDHVAGLAASRIVGRKLPSGFFGLIESFDRHERQEFAKQLLERSEIRTEVLSEEAVSELQRRIAQLARSLRETQDDYSELFSTYDEVDKKLVIIEEELSQKKLELEVKSAHIADISKRMDLLKQSNRTNAPEELLSAMRAVVDNDTTPEEALLVISTLYSTRVEVLPSAWKSCKESREFIYCTELLDLLQKLVTDYWEALAKGKGDGEAKAVFGNSFAATESERVQTNKRAVSLRTFEYNGEWRPMMKHLKIGTKDSATETIRVHFDWNAQEKRILIGYCGPHLDFK